MALLAQDPVKNWSDAIAHAQQGALLYPKNGVVQIAVGRLFEASQQYRQAVEAYRKALDLDSDLIEARSALVELRLRLGQVDEALAEVKGPAVGRPNDGTLPLLLGKLLFRKKDYAGASAAFEKAVAAEPAVAEAHALLGTAQYYVGNLKGAVAAYGKATELAPTNMEYLATYGLFLGYDGRHEAGIEALKKVTEQPGYKDVGGFINFGWLCRAVKPPRMAESVTAYQRALAIDPNNGQAALGIALAYYGNSQWDEAIAAFRRLSETDKKLAGDAFGGIAWSYYYKRDMVEARAFADKASAAGVPDADDIRRAITKYEEARQKSQQDADEAIGKEQKRGEATLVQALIGQLRSGTPDQQVHAAGQLCKIGRDAAPQLAYALFIASLPARQEAASCLLNMGCGAQGTLPMLQRVVNAGPPPPDPNASPEKARIEVEEGRLFGTVAQIATKLKACP